MYSFGTKGKSQLKCIGFEVYIVMILPNKVIIKNTFAFKLTFTFVHCETQDQNQHFLFLLSIEGTVLHE